MSSSVRPGTAAKILVAEDDRQVRESLVRVLEFEGYGVLAVNDGAQALGAFDDYGPDILVTDVMMPMVDGLDVCRRLRARGDRTPILILTARVEVSDRVAGLDAGADDYLPKPFALDELLARIRALLRRVDPPEATAPVVVDDLELDPQRRQVTRRGRGIELTKTEFDLLELLMHNEGIVLERSTIYERIWGYDFGTNSKSLDVYIGYLRRKTEAAGEHRLLHTVRGVGYVLRRG
ncbi:MAG: response regulator transcription factor [Actinomycetota bacterium]